MGIQTNQTSVPQFDQLEIVKSGVATMTLSGDTTKDLIITHNLGYAPIPLVYRESGGVYFPLPVLATYANTSANSGEISAWYYCGTDSTSLAIQRLALGSAPTPVSGTVNFRYYLMRSTAST